MGTNNPKRHHYIPRFLLRNFLDEDGQLWIYDKGQGKIYRASPKNAFTISDLYTTYEFDHIRKNAEYEEFVDSVKKDYKYEVNYFAGGIESKAAPVISQIIKSARSHKLPQLSSEQANDWKRFALALARRTPESQKRVKSGGDRDLFYEATKAGAHEVKHDLPDREIIYQDPRVLKLRNLVMASVDAKYAAGDDARARSEVNRFCRETGLCIAVICNPSPQNSFLIGSHGLAIVQSSHPKDLVNGSWFPIAHDVAILATPVPGKVFLRILNNERTHVIETINAASVAQSQIIAGCSEYLVRSLEAK